MDTRDFLASVVPWDSGGYVTIVWQRPDQKWPGRSCRTIDDALVAIADALKGRNNIFFCLSSQRTNSGKRSRDNATGICSLWTDSDVDPNNPKKYPSLEAAAADILYFCKLLEIPPPSIMVASGGGLHCYWLSDRTLPIEVWQSYANAFKNAARSSSLKIDVGVTGDAARILRVPGTFNYKYDPPRQVRLIQKFCNGVKHDFSVVFAELLSVHAEGPELATPFKTIEIADAFKQLDPNQSLGEGIEIRDVGPLPLQPILDGCGWLHEAHKTGGKEFSQGEWNLTTLIATFLEDGHANAHRFADQYPRYLYRQTEELWERKNWERRDKNLGWPSCRAISDEGSTHCKSCPHFIKGKSPLHLGFDVVTAARNAKIEDQELKTLGGKKAPELRLPEGYALDEKGRICLYVPTREIKGKGVQPGGLEVLLLSQVRNPIFTLKEGRFGLAFTVVTEVGGSNEVFVASNNCRGEGLFKTLGERFVLFNVERKGMPMVEKFMVSWLDKLRLEDRATRSMSNTMGWHFEEGHRTAFVYGNVVYKTDGSTDRVRATADDEFRSWYVPTGKREVWLKAAKLLTDRKRPELDILISIAFAAPLVTFAGTLYGAILSVWGPPGTSKSTGQQVAAAVWGHPKQTRESLNSTPKSIQGRLGRTRNLPAYWDDVQDEKHQLALFETMFVASEGAEGGRLNPDATYKQRLEWQTLLVACSNISFVDFLIKKQKSTTAGMRRVFEIEFNKGYAEPGIVNALDASKAFQDLEHHFGVIGAEYAQMLATEHEQINLLVDDVIKKFTRRVQGSGDENYWCGMCGVLIAGAMLARRLGAEVDPVRMEEFLVQTFLHNRKVRSIEGTEGGTYENIEQTLTMFLNFCIGNGHVLYVDNLFNRRLKVTDLKAPGINKQILVQIVRDERTVVISRQGLRSYLQQNSLSHRQIFNGLKKYFKAREIKLTLGAGTSFAHAQEHCFEIRVPPGSYTILEGVLTACGPAQGYFHDDAVQPKKRAEGS